MAKKSKMSEHQAELLLEKYAYNFNKKRALDELMKTYREELEVFAVENELLFNGKKTLSMINGKLVWKQKTTVKTSENFNPTEFLKAYPDAAEVKVKPSKLINIDLEQWGIDKQEEQVFAVEVTK